ncbi:3'(2'),5'-bisphosphate nucleotidase CysQ [Microvirga sp. 2TAF3]|uniref:3'(2'),5'-bisphosphate nucleotidase CysQ n=1 Tax=Microvirga sp. 2TAF3 TaxID=3233014 RepID=UPI003F9AFED0
MSFDVTALLLAQIAVAAGEPIMEIYRRGFSTAWKADASPVTEADLASERLIMQRLAALFPGIPVIAEECMATGPAPVIGPQFILVDPLDGTLEFMTHGSEFTVNLALVLNGRTVAGAIYAPLQERLWFSDKESHTVKVAPGASLAAIAKARRITARIPPPSGLVALISRSHLDPATENYLSRLPITECRAMGSSLKFCLIAQGEADIYPRLNPTCEWDTAAGHAILAAAGGHVIAPDGQPLRYGNRAGGFRQQGFIACGRIRIESLGLHVRTGC